jgi:hypothetical protein
MSAKTLAILAVVVLLAGFRISEIYVPDDFEKPLTYRAYASVMRFFTYAVLFSLKF